MESLGNNEPGRGERADGRSGVPTAMAEVQAVTEEVRRILDDLPRREKVDLSSRAGWAALQEATFSKRLGEQIPGATLVRLRALCVKWQRLYKQLQFEALTRPVWNT